jgi:hypothetical protein
MVGDEPGDSGPESQGLVKRLFRWHLLAYCGVMGTLTVVNFVIGGGWWTFWPLCAWGLVLSLHYFYYKSVTIDEAWVQERTDDMRMRSYDVSHIYDIKGRVKKRDASVRPSDERES